ncbi:MAG: Tat pathway signal protein [Bacteroidales bacterium]|jgi:hypothetical protein|nr:hypothetical protein [Bacteroidales bacterium]NLO50602.1 Tat pathway signal protein [Bacteroidales bacterium]
MKHLLLLILSTLLLTMVFLACNQQSQKEAGANSLAMDDSLNPDDLHRRTFDYFWETVDSVSGLTPDRWPTESFSSIAAMGFGFTAYITGVENNYITRQQAAERVLKTLRFIMNLPMGDATTGVAGYKGFFYHFLDMRTGLRYKQVELSTIDTGLLMAGILSCYEYFDGADSTEAEIRQLADSLYRRVEWDWFLNDNQLLSMGWHPETKKFLDAQWNGYNEAMILNILALGSPTHSIPAVVWENWTATYLWADYQGFAHVNFGPLFGHQYSHMYIDFRGIHDAYMQARGIDYFENSRRATLANRAYCIQNPTGFAGYGKDIWGLTACDGPGHKRQRIGGNTIEFMGYRARGAAADYLVDDGTITPTAAGGSIPFAPAVCLSALSEMYQRYGKRLYDRYGFKDAFNLTFVDDKNPDGWFDEDYIGIDQGAILIMLENHRTELIWELMKRNKYIREGLQKAGFSGGWLEKEE